MKRLVLAALLLSGAAGAQSLPDPYNPPERHWTKLPDGRPWGASAGIEFGPHGELWAIDRCGGNSCDGSSLPAVYQLDPRTGKVLKAIGAGLFAFPHGLHVDRDGNVWVTDPALSKDGKIGQQVVKLSPDGKVLLRLGMAGMAGGGAMMFSNPGDVITAPDGSIFVIDGHGTVEPNLPPDTIVRVIHFTRNGRFLKSWGSLGSGKSQFRNPHAVAFDSQGRLLVADRVNGRIQIFSQNGDWLAEYRGFGAPSGLAVTPDDTLYAVDYNTEGRKGIYIGSARTGAVTGFVPDDQAGEGIAAGPDGTLYEATPTGLTRFTRKN